MEVHEPGDELGAAADGAAAGVAFVDRAVAVVVEPVAGLGHRIDAALARIRTLLDNTRHPTIPADVPHAYDDKYRLVEFVTRASVAGVLSCLEAAGLTPGTPVTLPSAEIFTALQTGTIDAAEWVGPYNDLAFGLFRAAKYYYYPGWHETGSTIEALVNQEAFDALPADLQAIVEIASQAVNTDMASEFMYHNAQGLVTLQEEHGVEVRGFPDEVMLEFMRLTDEYYDEEAAKDETFARVLASYRAYRDQIMPLSEISEQRLMNLRTLGQRS